MRCTGRILVIAFAAVMLLASATFAGDIFNCPTANQQQAGQIDLGFYWVDPHNPNPKAPSHLNCYKAYLGVTNEVEIDAHVFDFNHATPAKTYWNATVLVVKEDLRHPAVVLGVDDIAQSATYPAGPRMGQRADRAFFVAAAKTVNSPARGEKPKFPIVRLHLGVGTERHHGFFGGVQTKLTREIGAVALFLPDDVLFAPDDDEWIYGLMYTPGPQWPTFKIAKCGHKDVLGISYNFVGRQSERASRR